MVADLAGNCPEINIGGEFMGEITKKPQWKAKHKPDCTDQSHYSVVKEYACVQDVDGNVLDADPHGEVVHADCSFCYAEATFE